MEDDRKWAAGDAEEITLDGFGPDEARQFKQVLVRFLHACGEKPAEVSDEDWLCKQLSSELPGLDMDEARQISQTTIASIQEYDRNLASLRLARDQGVTAAEWFAEQARKASAGVPAIAFGQRMEELGSVLSEANAQLYRTVTTRSGEISRQLNLDGFLAEQQAVNSFNAAAKLDGSPFYAEVCVPKPGETYGKNSFDVVIKNADGHIAHQYQFKYGKDAEATIQMIQRGNYNNQTLVVPPEQVEQVQAAFPGKTVVSRIGGTEKVPTASTPFSKGDMKAMQEEIQSTGKIPESDWNNSFSSQGLAKYVGHQAMTAGVQGAMLGAGFSLAEKIMSDEPVEVEDVVADALYSGMDATVKAAVAGAITVAVEKGALGVMAPLASAVPIANIACVAVENVKILALAAEDELTPGEALDEMGRNTTAMCCGMCFAVKGMAIGAAAFGVIPVIGPIIGGFAGGVAGYAAGSGVGQKVYGAVKAVAKSAVKTAKRLVEDGAQSLRRIGQRLGRLAELA